MTRGQPLAVGVLASGRGSNLQALLEACASPGFPARIALVISDKEQAQALERARACGVEALWINPKDFADRESFDAALVREFQARNVGLVCHAGFMRIQSEAFAARWLGRQLNIHPSLLPAFKGLHPHKQALDAGVRISGCTVHFVTPELDSGPVVAQAAVAVHEGDTPETLGDRILVAEHRLYPFALRLVASGSARLENGRVMFKSSINQANFLFSPMP